MIDDFKDLQAALARKHLGRRGINGLNIDADTRTLNLYVDFDADAKRAVTGVRRDARDLKIKTIRSRRARLL